MFRILLLLPVVLNFVQCLPLEEFGGEGTLQSPIPNLAPGHDTTSEELDEIELLGRIKPGFERFGDQVLPIQNGKRSRNAIASDNQRWPSGVVPYEIHSSLNHIRSDILRAFQHYAQNTCIRFVPRTTETNYINIFYGQGCWSYVGDLNQGMQQVSLGQGCEPFGTIVHELGHAIGFNHEQNRSDRDNSLVIYWDNIQQGMASQFTKLAPTQNRLFSDFDVNSIMLYGNTAFSKDGRSVTMAARNGWPLKEVYDKTGLSNHDIYRIKRLYGC